VLKLTQEHVDRAFSIARWYGRHARRAEVTDLESAALEGLAKAARDWDPHRQARGPSRAKGSFWKFAFARIVGEMRDELRRFDHLTRTQRRIVSTDAGGHLTLADKDLNWLNPEEPMPLDASVIAEGVETKPVVDCVETERNPIDAFELRDAFVRAGADVRARELLMFVKRELEGYSNCELAEAFEVTEGRASQLRWAAADRMREHIGDSFLDTG
jgi:RNA polymerase sigma factor (sigma-70 family)